MTYLILVFGILVLAPPLIKGKQRNIKVHKTVGNDNIKIFFSIILEELIQTDLSPQPFHFMVQCALWKNFI